MNWRARISPDLVIIAVCARPYVVAAAQAGYKVAAFDIFNDVETRRLSVSSAQVEFSDGGFDTDDLWRKLCTVPSRDAPVVYGSGLESQPQLLDNISRQFKLLGNTPKTVSRLKHPRRFFALLDELGIAHPETRLAIPPGRDGWLAKRMGGSGGTHVRPWDGHASDYYQRLIDGVPVSVLFIADGADAEIVGCNEQWLAPAPGMPFRYGGAVGNADLPDVVKAAMADAARKVTAAAGLVGLNSMDFILAPDTTPLALEVNPRLSATFDLYNIPDLFERHLLGCRRVLQPLPKPPADSRAHLIYYAGRNIVVEAAMEWPTWTTDRPVAGTVCRAGDPLCTVVAQADDAQRAKQLVFARAHQLDAQLRTFTKHTFVKHLGKQ